jgi:hypothetical protein
MVDVQQSRSCILVGLLQSRNDPLPCILVQLFALHNKNKSNDDNDDNIAFQLMMS